MESGWAWIEYKSESKPASSVYPGSRLQFLSSGPHVDFPQQKTLTCKMKATLTLHTAFGYGVCRSNRNQTGTESEQCTRTWKDGGKDSFLFLNHAI